MKVETKHRKKAMVGFRLITPQEQMRQRMHDILPMGIQALSQVTLELGGGGTGSLGPGSVLSFGKSSLAHYLLTAGRVNA